MYWGWNQFLTVNDVPAEYFDHRRAIFAMVERVIDGDTIRVRHLPRYSQWLWGAPEPLSQQGIADCTLSIRIYGVDAPELAKNKAQRSQPFAEEAKEFMTRLALHKVVKLTFLRRDQYRRAVCVVETLLGRRKKSAKGGTTMFCEEAGARDVSAELARAGLAELYTAGGAEYYGRRDLLEEQIAHAQRKRLGIWSMGKSRVSAYDHKKTFGRCRGSQR